MEFTIWKNGKWYKKKFLFVFSEKKSRKSISNKFTWLLICLRKIKIYFFKEMQWINCISFRFKTKVYDIKKEDFYMNK